MAVAASGGQGDDGEDCDGPGICGTIMCCAIAIEFSVQSLEMIE